MKAITKETPLAVVGVSQNPEKYGHKIFRDLVEAGYTVSGIHPKGGQAAGQELYTSLKEVQPKPELIICVVPPKNGVSVMKEAKALEIHDMWLQPGAESDELTALAAELGIHVTTNTCFMVKEGLW